jgi:hypothetical protein
MVRETSYKVVDMIGKVCNKGKIVEVETRTDGAAYEGIVADRSSGLPNPRGHDRHMLTSVAAQLMASELVVVGIVGDEFEGLAAIEMPNFIGFDDMPTANLSSGQQIVNGSESRSGAALGVEENGRSVEFAIPAAFGVGLELEPIDEGLDLWRWGGHGARYLFTAQLL